MEENVPPVPETDKNPTPPATPDKPVTPVEEKKKKKISTKKILWIIFIVVIILVPVVIYFIKDCEINRLKEKQAVEIQAIKQQASDKVDLNNNANLIIVGKIFSWAVRGELTRDNKDQVNQMMIELVKENDYRQVVLLSGDGSVVLSTDKKFEGEGFNNSVYEALLGSDNVQVSPQKNGDLLVAAPVFGIDSRLGTVIITYRPSVLEFSNTTTESK
jgi:cell division protein FtsL